MCDVIHQRSRSLRLSRLIQEIKNLRDLLQQKTIDDEEIITLITAPNPMENLSLSKNFLDHVTKFRNSLAQEFVKLDGDCQRIIKEIMHIAGRLNIDNGVNIQQPVSARFLQHVSFTCVFSIMTISLLIELLVEYLSLDSDGNGK